MRHLWLDQPETSNHSLITFAQAENRVLKVLVLEYPDAKHLNTLAKGGYGQQQSNYIYRFNSQFNSLTLIIRLTF